jgi:hypothetical protein
LNSSFIPITRQTGRTYSDLKSKLIAVARQAFEAYNASNGNEADIDDVGPAITCNLFLFLFFIFNLKINQTLLSLNPSSNLEGRKT